MNQHRTKTTVTWPDPLDPGEWSVIVTHHGKGETQTAPDLSFQEMLAMLIPPMGVALNRDQRITMSAQRNGVERMKIEFYPADQGEKTT